MVGLPWVTIQQEGRSTVSGVGDLSAAIRAQVFQNVDTRILLSLNGELPAGDEAKGLGGGHFELAPMLRLAHRIHGQVRIVASATHGIVLDRGHQHDHDHQHEQDSHHRHDAQHVVRPHGPHETISSVGILYSTERGFLESALQSGFGVSGGEILQAPTEFRISGGVNLSDGVAFTLGTMQTLIGPKRNPWVVDLGLTMMFGSETDGVNLGRAARFRSSPSRTWRWKRDP